MPELPGLSTLLLRNARLVPGLAAAGSAELADVRIRGGRISLVEAAGVRGPAGRAPGAAVPDGPPDSPPEETIDLDGRWLVPGLWDEHVHMGHWAKARHRIELSRAESAAAAVALVVAGAPAGAGTVIGAGFHDGLWPDAPDRRLLDPAFPDRPVVLVSNDLHSVWLNTAALRRHGLPVSGDGRLREAAAFRVQAALDEGGEAELDAAVAAAGRAAAARGVVGIHDLEMGWCLGDWARRMAAGFDAFRVRAGIYAPELDRAEEERLRTGQALGPLLAVGSFKAITDGSLGTRTAYCVDPYPGTHDHGVLAVPSEELRVQLGRAKRLGLEPAIHAIGDEANRLALDALIALGLRGRIEHAQLVRDEDLARFGPAGIEASVQPEHAMDDRDLADRYWAGRTERAFPLRTLLDAGATLRFGSDAPVSPLDPWLAISAAVRRSRDGREPWHGEQRVSATEALRASTRSLVAAGEPADLVALDADPLGDPAALRGMPVALTLCAGRATHDAVRR